MLQISPDYAIHDRLTNLPIGKTYPHEEQAWTEAYERKLVQQGRFGSRGEKLDLLHPNYEIREVKEATE